MLFCYCPVSLHIFPFLSVPAAHSSLHAPRELILKVSEPRVLDNLLFEYEQLGYLVTERDTGYEYVGLTLPLLIPRTSAPGFVAVPKLAPSYESLWHVLLTKLLMIMPPPLPSLLASGTTFISTMRSLHEQRREESDTWASWHMWRVVIALAGYGMDTGAPRGRG